MGALLAVVREPPKDGFAPAMARAGSPGAVVCLRTEGAPATKTHTRTAEGWQTKGFDQVRHIVAPIN